MELALTLGEPPARLSEKIAGLAGGGGWTSTGLKLGFCIGIEEGENRSFEAKEREERRGSVDPPVQLNLLPLVPAPHLGFPWSSENRTLEPSKAMRVFDVNQVPSAEEVAAMSSPNSTLSSFHADVAGGVAAAAEMDRASPRASDEDDNGGSRKKLRLSKEQSVFLEESFKEHNTLNPKQKLALARQLNLRPRQVEVWFQNRRARTKLKQTEVDCEYLKRCCETLREENRRLQKELAELRALKTSQPFYMQLPATTLSMCPSCERVSSNSTSVAAAGGCSGSGSGGSASHPTAAAEKSVTLAPSFVASLFPKARLYPFGSPPRTPAHQSSAAS